MKKISVVVALIALVTLSGVYYLYGQEIPVLKPLEKDTALTVSKGEYMVITKVKKPWAAPKRLVTRKFIASIPEYSGIPGLQFKSYSFTEDYNYFGGIYLWKDEQSAKNWFSTEWRQRVREKYKSEGQVLYYEVTGSHTVRSITKTKGRYWTVISAANTTFTKIPKGLLRIVYIKDANANNAHITLWEREGDAREYFREFTTVNQYFHTPVLINNL